MKIPNAERGGSRPLGRDHLRAMDTGRVLVKCSTEWIRVTEDPVGKNTDEDTLVQGAGGWRAEENWKAILGMPFPTGVSATANS